ncbi:DUF4145 domain-containing protein [Salmonella enterica subsp. enterica]
MKRYIYLLKNDIDFLTDSKIKFMSFSYPDKSSVLKEINISGTNSEQIIKRLSLDKNNYADVEYFEDRLIINIEAISFFKNVFNSMKCAQYGLSHCIEINAILIPAINELNGTFPHYIEIEFTRIIRKNIPQINLSSILRNIYFNERSEIISSVLCVEKVIVEIINERFQDEKIEIMTKKGIKKISINESRLEQKISFLHDKNIIDEALYSILEVLRKMRNHAAHDLSLTESVYNETIVGLTSEFVIQAEERYNLRTDTVARFSNCFMYVFDEISSFSSCSDSFILGRQNSDQWNSFFYGA